MKKIIFVAAASLFATAAFAQNGTAVTTGHVNTTELIQLMPAMDTVRTRLDEAQKEANETYNAMVEEFQGKVSTYQQKQASWTPAIKASKEKELQDIQARLEEFQQTIGQELQQMQQSLQAPIYQKVNEAIQNISKEKKLAYVFDVQTLLYVDSAQSIDLTPELRVILGIPEGRTLASLQEELQAKAAAAQQQ